MSSYLTGGEWHHTKKTAAESKEGGELPQNGLWDKNIKFDPALMNLRLQVAGLHPLHNIQH